MRGSPPRVLLVEDEPAIRGAVVTALAQAGYLARAETDGTRLRAVAAAFRPDLAILDIMLPAGPDGLALARKLRDGADLPILFLTARDGLDDRLAGFTAGADDYLVKPFALRELLARVNALLRRTKPVRDVLGYANLTLDLTTRTASRDGVEINLTRIEFALLELLLRNAEQVLSYDVILDRVWGYGEAPASNALQVFVGFLRRKLEENGQRRLVHNVRGVGYVLRAQP